MIGDVHGYWHTLEALIAKLPHDAKLIFVGDLIDRGPHSAQVVQFVKDHHHLCVRGNHEEAMVTYGEVIETCYTQNEKFPSHSYWLSNGGVATLQSYGLIELVDGRVVKKNDERGWQAFQADRRWMATLPLWIEVECDRSLGRRTVVSHASIASGWMMRHNEAMSSVFATLAMTNRREPAPDDAPIFNIFGHTPTSEGPVIKEHYVNVDTGCYKNDEGYGYLSAYDLQTGDVIRIKRIEP